MPISTLQEVFEAARGGLMINLEIKTNHRANFATTFNAAVALARQMDMADHIFWKIPPPVRGKTGLPYVMPIIWQSERDFEQQVRDFSGHAIRGFEIVTGDLDYWPVGPDGRIIGADRNRYMMVGVLPRWSGGLSDDRAVADPEAIWGRMIALGADVIMTSRPEALITYLKARGLR